MLSRRLAAVCVLACALVASAACGAGGVGLNRQYEYEEDVYLAVDGSATIVVNASLPALVALHGMPLPVDPRARLDRAEIRRLFESAVADVTRVSRAWRRRGRRFVQVRLEVPDIRRLSEAPVFAGSSYHLTTTGERTTFRQRVGGTRRQAVPQANWNGSELVAFKLHLPSRVYYHNVRDLETKETGAVERGNILRWEQRLSDRLAGTPLEMEVRMDRESILYRTLWLFAGAFVAAMVLLVGLIWWTVRRGRRRSDPARAA